MKIAKKQVIKVLMLTALFQTISLASFSQNQVQPNPISINIGISDLWDFMDYNNVYGVYNFNANYRITPYVAAGVEAGYGGLKLYDYFNNTTSIGGHAIFYSLDGYFYFTPLYSENPHPRLDLYLKGKLGGISFILTDEEMGDPQDADKFEFDYGIYAGCKIRIFKSFGAFAEIGYGKATFTQFGLYIGLGK